MIAIDEWRYWLRSRLALSGTVLFIVLLVVSSLVTGQRMATESQTRTAYQADADKTFLTQPDRHPHRMVHYGHYVFRAPSPLSVFDPGLDAVTGQAIFLEGHRQNTAMFSDAGASSGLGSFSRLTPALIYQLFAPLLIIVLGHGSVVREREAGVMASLLAQGVTGRCLVLGKLLALLTFITLLLIPMIGSGLHARIHGERLPTLFAMLSSYLGYLSLWALLTVCVSAALTQRAKVLMTLSTMWLVFTLLLPAMAVNVAAFLSPLPGKIATDLTMRSEKRQLGDGHNANDRAFAELRANLLKQYSVERIEDLPVNYRGMVALESERKLTTLLNQYTDRRFMAESEQARRLTQQGWITPTLAIAHVSRVLSGTDIEHYHRFLREAEAVRYEFVQGLNQAHVDKLSYQDDINRNKDAASGLKARVDASNWQVLSRFTFTSATFGERWLNAWPSIVILCVWLGASMAFLFWRSARIQP